MEDFGFIITRYVNSEMTNKFYDSFNAQSNGLASVITKSDFNAILVNRYASGDDYIGAHSDDEKSLGPNGVVTISIGQERILRIRDKKTKQITQI